MQEQARSGAGGGQAQDDAQGQRPEGCEADLELGRQAEGERVRRDPEPDEGADRRQHAVESLPAEKAHPMPVDRKAGRMWWSSRARVKPFMPTNPALMTSPSKAQASTLRSNWNGVQGRVGRRAFREAAPTSPRVPRRPNWTAAERYGWARTQSR